MAVQWWYAEVVCRSKSKVILRGVHRIRVGVFASEFLGNTDCVGPTGSE